MYGLRTKLTKIFTHLEVLIKAFQSVLTDEEFELPTPPAIAAKRGAEQVLAWHATTANEEVSIFAQQLVLMLQSCFKEMKKQKDRREKMFEQLYMLRSTNEFADKWVTFLKKCGVTDPTPTLFQHITDKVFNHLITVNYQKPTESSTVQVPQLDYKERNALRYVAGYVTRTIYHKLKDSKHPLKGELLLCLTELNDVDPSEMEDESKDWMEIVDRGGLTHISNMTYMMFASVELELRKHIMVQKRSTGSGELHLTKAKEEVIASDDVQFYWTMVSSNWQEDAATALLEMMIDLWIQIRGHSTATAWLEKYKQDKKIPVQKSKGVRKQLISSKKSESSTDS